MAENKTQKTTVEPSTYIASITDEGRRADIQDIHDMMCMVSGMPAKMWGASIVGFGDYHYKYASGREGDHFRIGYSNRVKQISIYIMPGYDDFDDELSRLGKASKGKSCLYIKRLADIDKAVLKEIMLKGLTLMEARYPTCN